MLGWLYQMILFVGAFAVPCLVFWASSVLARELRDFFESSVLGIAVHLLLTVFFALAVARLTNVIFTAEQIALYGLLIRLGVMLIVTAWVFGATGCLYDDQAPNKRMSAGSIKRYR